jgi:hypothetical protein
VRNRAQLALGYRSRRPEYDRDTRRLEHVAPAKRGPQGRIAEAALGTRIDNGADANAADPCHDHE